MLDRPLEAVKLFLVLLVPHRSLAVILKFQDDVRWDRIVINFQETQDLLRPLKP